MIYKKIETTTEEVLGFMQDAGIALENAPDITAFQIRLADDSAVELPPDLNIFGEMSLFAATGSYLYRFSANESNGEHYVSGNIDERYDNRIDPHSYIPAA